MILRSLDPQPGDWYGIRTTDYDQQVFLSGGVSIQHAQGAISIEEPTPVMPDLVALRNATVSFVDNVSDICFDRDLIVPQQTTLVVEGGWKIGFTGSDGSFGGKDPELCELVVSDAILQAGYPLYQSGPVSFVSNVPGLDPGEKAWYGIRFRTQWAVDSVYIDCGSFISDAEITGAKYPVAIERHCAPSLTNIAFDPVYPIHILLDSVDVAIPQNGEWVLQGPTYVVARNESKDDWDFEPGETKKVDLLAHGKLFTSGDGPHRVTFKPEFPNDATGNNWGGVFLDWPSSGSLVEWAEFSHAANPLCLYYPDQSTAIRNCTIHHFRDTALWIAFASGAGAVVDSCTVERGAGLPLLYGNVGMLLEQGGPLTVDENVIDLTGVDNSTGGAGIRFQNTWGYCLDAQIPPEAVLLGRNELIGPAEAQGANLKWSGIELIWACGANGEQVTVMDNRITQWNLAGLKIDQSSDVQVSCNLITDNQVSVDFSRDGLASGPNVRLKDNTLEGHEDFGVRTDHAGTLKLGPQMSNRGNNVLKTEGLKDFIRENDENASRILNAEGNQWYVDDVFTTHVPTILTLIDKDPGVMDPARVDVDPVIGSPSDPTCDVPAAVLQSLQQAELGVDRPGQENLTELPASGTIPLETTLGSARPTPFRARTVLELGVSPADAGRVSVRIYSVQGRLVRSLWEGAVEAGIRQMPWDGLNASGEVVAPGIYFARLEAGGISIVRKLVKVQ